MVKNNRQLIQDNPNHKAIHWDKALEQAQTHAALKELNQTIKLDKPQRCILF